MSGMIPADAVAIGVGAFLGALSRYQCGRLAAEWIATDPNKLGKLTGWHTAGINIGGSFLLGGITASPVMSSSPPPPPPLSHPSKTPPFPPPPQGLVKPQPPPSSLSTKMFSNGRFQGLSPRTKLMLGVGFCGSYTTFSTYSVDVVTWLSQGQTSKALSYVATNNVGGFLAAAAGMVLVKRFFG